MPTQNSKGFGPTRPTAKIKPDQLKPERRTTSFQALAQPPYFDQVSWPRCSMGFLMTNARFFSKHSTTSNGGKRLGIVIYICIYTCFSDTVIQSLLVEQFCDIKNQEPLSANLGEGKAEKTRRSKVKNSRNHFERNSTYPK